MGALDTPGWGEFEKLVQRVRALETQSPLESSSVKNGRVRFVGGELRIDSGGQLIIKGTLSVDGSSTVTGTFTVSGPWNLAGNGTITGATSITGALTISGDVTVTGKLTQNGDWELNGNGKIQGAVDVSGRVNVGTAMALNPSANGGQLEFPSGYVAAISGAIGLYKSGGGQVVLNTSGVAITGGGPGLTLTASAMLVTSLPTVAQASVPGSFKDAIVYWGGEFRRVV